MFRDDDADSAAPGGGEAARVEIGACNSGSATALSTRARVDALNALMLFSTRETVGHVETRARRATASVIGGIMRANDRDARRDSEGEGLASQMRGCGSGRRIGKTKRRSET